MIARLSSKYKYPPLSIIAMDETSVWNVMVSNTTINKQGAKFVCLKTTGHEKYMVSICLAAKADETKLKSFVVFSAPKQESELLDEEFESCCVVKSYHLGKTSFRCLFVQLTTFTLGLL